MNIELDALSGRPNPSWDLGASETAELLALLKDLPAAQMHNPPDLGYRGFVVRAVQGAKTLETRVFGGTVMVGGVAQADVRGAEAWLKHSARGHGWSAIVDSVVPP